MKLLEISCPLWQLEVYTGMNIHCAFIIDNYLPGLNADFSHLLYVYSFYYNNFGMAFQLIKVILMLQANVLSAVLADLSRTKTLVFKGALCVIQILVRDCPDTSKNHHGSELASGINTCYNMQAWPNRLTKTNHREG